MALAMRGIESTHDENQDGPSILTAMARASVKEKEKEGMGKVDIDELLDHVSGSPAISRL